MKVVYLINQYPKISHTFIRREINALEDLGVEVLRAASRLGPEELVDPRDKSEVSKTHFLLSQRSELLLACLSACIFSPRRALASLKAMLRIRSNSSGGAVRHFAYWAQAAYLAKFCHQHDISHVHAHFSTSPATIALLCNRLGGPTYSFTVHGPEDFDNPVGLSIPEKIRSASAVVAITSFCKSQLSRWCDYNHWGKIQIVHCAVGDEYFETPIAPLPESFSMLSIGRLCEQKGQMVIVEAIRLLKQQGTIVNCKIVGDGELRPIIESKISEYDLASQISILGWKSSEEIQSLIDSSSILLLPSFAEGLPVVIMESLARARPALTTYIAGIPELIEDGENGWLVPAGDTVALAEAIDKAASTPIPVLEEMGLRGKAAIIDQHSARKEAQKLQQIFLNCIG